MHSAVPLASAIISFVFAIIVLDQYFARRKPYQLIWSIGLLMYAVSTGCEFWAEARGLTSLTYQVWYLFGAIFSAAYLGMGTLYLLVRRRVVHYILAVMIVLSIYAAVRIFSSSVDIGNAQTLAGISKVMPSDVRILTPIFNVFGTIALVGGALYSAWIFWRKRILPNRMIGNILIAIGALLPVVSGTGTKVAGSFQLSYLFELLGIIIIFIGFLRTREVFGLYRFPLIHGFARVASKTDIK
jgi:hypothetical protein